MPRDHEYFWRNIFLSSCVHFSPHRHFFFFFFLLWVHNTWAALNLFLVDYLQTIRRHAIDEYLTSLRTVTAAGTFVTSVARVRYHHCPLSFSLFLIDYALFLKWKLGHIANGRQLVYHHESYDQMQWCYCYYTII